MKLGKNASEKKRILITGGAGGVGSAIRRELSDRYVFRVIDVVPPQNQGEGDDFVSGDAADYATMVAAADGVDAIIHLARVSVNKDHVPRKARRHSPLRAKHTFQTDMPSVWTALEAARINGVKVVVYSSSNHVTGLNEQDGLLSRPELPVRPDGIYGAGKAFGEAIGRFYADRMGVRVCCIRIVNYKDEPGRLYEPGHSRWFSPRDLGQMVWRCIETEDIQFGIFYGVSGGAEKRFDIANARELLGYEPEDDGSAAHWRQKYLKEGE